LAIPNSATRSKHTPSKHNNPIRGFSPSVSPAAATISGDGVSPAASAAANGSPPGSAADTCNAEMGRFAGSFSRHRSITRSISGSRSRTSVDGFVGAASSLAFINSGRVAAS
jgi:hypothetical protein